MELKSGDTFDAKIKDVDEKADIALIQIHAPVSFSLSRHVTSLRLSLNKLPEQKPWFELVWVSKIKALVMKVDQWSSSTAERAFSCGLI